MPATRVPLACALLYPQQILISIHLARDSQKRNADQENGDDSLPVRPMKPKKTILCVDDNEQALSIRKIMLETRGYRVLACNSGEVALEAFRRGGVDLVLTDLNMPGVDGPRLIEEIKSISPQTPAVLISSRTKVYERETLADFFCPRECTSPRTCSSAFACCWCASAAPNARWNCVSPPWPWSRATWRERRLRPDPNFAPASCDMVFTGCRPLSKPGNCARPTGWAKLMCPPCAASPSACKKGSSSPSWGRRAAASPRFFICWAD